MDHSEDYNDRSNLGVILDPEVKYKFPSSSIPAAHFNVLKLYRQKWKGELILNVEELKELHQVVIEYNANNEEKVYLHELMEGGELITPKLEIPERNPELDKRVKALRNSLAEKEYQKMTRNVNSTSRYKPEDSVAYQMKSMNSGLIAVFQFVISLACAFFFGFVGIELFIGNLQLAVRLGLGIASALIVGAAELYFLAINLDVAEDPEKFTPTPFQKSSIISETISSPSIQLESHQDKTETKKTL